jgi:uncharacterized protein
MTDSPALPMFPLGSVLLPGMLLPLHVFEPRYRALVDHVLQGDGRFGVVLIERGHEVGGGDQRSDVGTVAEVVRTEVLPDGRWALLVAGRERIRVDRWLDDDPYPRAEVHAWPDQASEASTDALLVDVTARLGRVHALASELGHPVPDTDLDDDPSLASFQASVLAGVGPLDTQRLLLAPDAYARLRLLVDLLQDQEQFLRLQLEGPDS